MNLLDLFSGIGGFSVGLERAGFTTVAFCEADPWCRRVLAKHWPRVPCYDDVRQLTAARLRADGIDRIDAICGGFPCQDISLAGKGAGLDGERSGLWREYARLLGELRPRYAIVENVGALRARGLAAVLADLAALCFDAESHAIPAAAVGAPHLRDRVWIVAAACDAHSDDGRQGRAGRPDPADSRQREPEWALQAGDAANADDIGRRGMDAAAWDGAEPRGLGAHRVGGAPADPTGPGSSQLRGLFGRLAGALAAASTPWQRTAEPPLRLLDDGLYAGLDRGGLKRLRTRERNELKALGNAVVPQIPELIGHALLATDA